MMEGESGMADRGRESWRPSEAMSCSNEGSDAEAGDEVEAIAVIEFKIEMDDANDDEEMKRKS